MAPMASALRTAAGSGSGRYISASTSATLRRRGSSYVRTIGSSDRTGPSVEHPQVKARTVMAHQQRRHLGHAEAQPDAVAGGPRLRDLELGCADAVPVATQTSASARPSTVKFSPNMPKEKSSRSRYCCQYR